ncbi:MAG: CHAT domain-containing protein [SAR324 cluster bacterium]|nr:CHAT domain-containing protein [SAR324 cluster bacterium]
MTHKKTLLFLVIFALTPSLYLPAKPLTPGQIKQISSGLKSSKDKSKTTKLYLLLVKNAQELEIASQEIEVRGELETFLKTSGENLELRKSNLYRIGALNYEEKDFQESFNSFKKLFVLSGIADPKTRDFALQSLVNTAARLGNIKLEEKYLALYVLAQAKSADFYKTKGGFKRLLALTSNSGSKKSHYYYNEWFETAKNGGKKPEQKGVLTDWANFAAKTKANFSPEPFEKYLDFIKDQKDQKDLRSITMLFAEATPDKAKQLQLYESAKELDQQSGTKTDLGVLTALYGSYEAKKDSVKEQEILEILAYREDYKGRKEALRRLAVLALKNKDWLPAIKTHQELIKLSPPDLSKEGLVFLDNLIFATASAQKDDLQLTYLQQKALSKNKDLNDKARLAAYAQAMKLFKAAKDLKGATRFYQDFLKSPKSQKFTKDNEIHFHYALNQEEALAFAESLATYQLSLDALAKLEKPKAKLGISVARKILNLTRRTKGKELPAQKQLLAWQEKAGDKKGQAKTQLIMAQAQEKAGDKKAALSGYNASLALYKATKNEKMTNQLLTLLLNLEGGGGEKKLERLLELETKQETAKDKSQLIATRIEIGHLYRGLKKQSEAIDYYKKALDPALPPSKDSPWASFYLGVSLSGAGDLAGSNKVYDAGIANQKMVKESPQAYSKMHLGKANNLSKQGQADQALAEIDKALSLKVKEEASPLLSAKTSILITAGKFAEAEKAVLGSLKRTKDPAQKSKAYILLARSYMGQKNYEAAIKNLDLAQKQLGDEGNGKAAGIQSMKAHALSQSGNNAKAVKVLLALTAKLEAAENKQALPQAYLQLASYQMELGQLAAASKSTQNAQAWIAEAPELGPRVYLNLGKIALKQKKFKESLEQFNKLEDELNEQSPKALQAEFHYQRGFANLQISKFDEALKDFEAAQNNFEALKQPAQARQSQMARANVLLQLGKMSEAEAIYQDLLGKAGKEAKGDIENALAFLYSEMGSYEKAIELSSKAEATYKKQNQKRRIPEVLNARGLIFLKMNDFAQAEVIFTKAIKANAPLNNPLLESEITNNLGGLYKSKGDPEKALQQLLKTAELQKKLGFESQLALTYNNIASVYLDQTKYEETLDYLKKSRNFSEKFDLKKELAASWNNEGILYFKQEKFSDAKSAFEEAVKLQRALELRLDLARTLNNLSIIANRKKDLKGALELVQQAVEALSLTKLSGGFYPNPEQNSVLAPDMMKGFLQNKGGFLKALAVEDPGKKADYLKSAYSSYALSIELIESLRSQIKGEESQQMLMSANIDIYQQLVSILYDLGEMEPEKGYHEKAFYYAEASRARSFLDQLAEQAAKESLKLPPEIRKREELLKNQVAALDQKIFVELKKPSAERNEKLIEDWQLQKTSFQLDYAKLIEEVEKKFPEFAALKYPKVYGVELAREKLLNDKTQVLVYSLGDNRSYGFVLGMTKFKMLLLPPNGDIDALIRRYRVTIKDPLVREDPEDDEMVIDGTQSHIVTGIQIFRTILEPLLEAGEPNIKQLILIPDGVLYYLPFETVVAKIHPQNSGKFAKGREYLLHRYSINYSPSTSVLGTIKTKVSGRDAAMMRKRKEFLGFGDPQYKPKNDKTFHYNPTLKQQGFYHLDRLFNTIKELKAISSVFPNSNKVYLRDEARESVVKKNLSGYKYIHFATHGILDERNPEFSGVVMNLVKAKKPEDGFLQASEIFELKINSDLVVLSACETGLGKVIKGEGMVGLTRAFMYAGTPSIVVSLWTVSDDSTSKLMIYFYRYLAKGLNKDEALRQAKIQLMNETSDDELVYHDPFYWGPFILNGTRN